nr:bifunctional DedA family/phosphatase PAP2 family protein [Pseudovibrio flavus]
MQQIVAFIGANPSLAGFICFFVAMGEALFLVGLFFPSTVVLVGAGTLIGLGKLDFTSIFLWTLAGAVVGDAVSYWVGYFFKDRIRTVWPFSKYSYLVDAGERFFEKHGGKSIFIGRFVPGVKSVVAGIAGMADMSLIKFQVVNVVSAVFWTAAHILPGVMAGSALSAISATNTRLAIVLGGLCLALLVAVVLIRWMIMFIMPVFGGSHQAIINWFARRPGSFSQWIAQTYNPENPRSVGMLFSAAVLLTTYPAFVWFISAISPDMPLARADEAINTLFETARTPRMDDFMISITMMGDGIVTTMITGAVALYLMRCKAWRRASGFIIAIASSALFVVIAKTLLGRDRPIELFDGAHSFSFPSGHTTINAVLWGVLAVLIAHERSLRVKTLIYSLAATFAIMIGFSRVYLGAHWMSDVVAGLFFGAGTTAVFGFIFGHISNEKIGRNTLAAIAVSTLLAISAFHIPAGFKEAQFDYRVRSGLLVMGYVQWRRTGWQNIPAKRINLIGEFEEDIVLQWSGTPDELQALMEKEGWRVAKDWSVPSAIGYLTGETPAIDLPPVPQTNLGRLPTLTMVMEGDIDHRQVFWLWKSRYQLAADDGAVEPLYTGTVISEETIRLFGEFSAITDDAEKGADIKRELVDLPHALMKSYPTGETVVIAGPRP